MHIRNIMCVRLIRGRVCYVFFLILKYIWYWCISRQKCNKNDRLVISGTKILCRWCFCVKKSTSLFFFFLCSRMNAHIKCTFLLSFMHCLQCAHSKPAGWFSLMRHWKVVYPVSHNYARKAFSFSPNPKRCWKILTWIKTKEYVIGRFLLCN